VQRTLQRALQSRRQSWLRSQDADRGLSADLRSEREELTIMATKINLRSQPRGSADGTGEVTLGLLREQFQRSFVPRMSEDGTETPCVVPRVTPSIHERRITNPRITGETKIVGASSSRIALKSADRS